MSLIKNLIVALCLTLISSGAKAQSADFSYIENGIKIEGFGTSGAWFADGPGTLSSTSPFPTAGIAMIGVSPNNNGSTYKITTTGNTDFKLTSFALAGFTPPAGFAITVTGYNASNTSVYSSGSIPVTGTGNFGGPFSAQSVSLNMPTLVRSLIISSVNGGADCICVANFVFSDGTTSILLLTGTAFATGPDAGNTTTALTMNATALRSVIDRRLSGLALMSSYD